MEHQCKDPNNHCNIDGHTEDKCWKLHPKLNPMNHKKDAKKNNLLGMDSSNQVESSSDVYEKIVYTSMQKEVNLSSLHHKEEKEMTNVVFGSPYMYMRDAIFMQRENQYHLIKDGKSYIINAHKGKSNISLVSANQAKKLISSSKKYVFLFLRENQPREESVRVKASLEGCTKEQKQ
jgi:hypothetical protein